MKKNTVTVDGKVYSMAGEQKGSRQIDGLKATSSSSTISAAHAKAKRVTPSTKKAARKSQRSATLHRKAVRKPSRTATTAHTSKVITRRHITTPKSRIQRAKTTSRSPMVGKFSAGGGVQPQVVPMTPKHSEERQPKAPPAYNPKTPKTDESVFDKHFKASTAVAKSSKKKSRSTAKKLSLGIPGALTALLITGFIAYQQIPYVSMRVAASRAGFNASLPNTPAGFSIDGPIAYSGGRVTVSFSSNTDTRSAKLHQQPSGLDSASLGSGYLSQRGIEYTEHTRSGRTVFIYNGSQATWVNKGIWYSLEGDSQLSVSQILDLAAST